MADEAGRQTIPGRDCTTGGQTVTAAWRERPGGAGDEVDARRAPATHSRRAVLRAAAGAAGAGLLLHAGEPGRLARAAAGAPAPAPAPSAVYPLPDTRTASPATEITFRGLSVDGLGPVGVVGSLSGGHSGIVLPHADGAGASYVPDAPFRPGERVTVRTTPPMAGGEGVAFEFTVARPATTEAAVSSRVTDKPGHTPQAFRSRPDLQPPPVTVTTPATRTAPGYLVVGTKVRDGQSGPMILDERGQVVWYAPLEVDIDSVNEVRVQRYRGQPVLTWWEGISAGGYGLGHFVILDDAYRTIARVQVGNGYPGADLHEFLLTPRGTALVLIYNPVRWDLAWVGGAASGAAMDSIVQEIEVATGRVLFEWHSLDHVGLDEAYVEPPTDPAEVFDYFHANAVEVDHDGNLIVTARNTWATYKIDRVTGEVIWRLGGKRSDFAMGEGTQTAYHHDARVLPNGELTLFDNAATPPVRDESRGLVLRCDMERMTATVVREYTHPDGVLAGSQGNMQGLPNGNVLVGWGSEPVISEFAEDGTLLFDARFPEGTNSYRAYRFPWTGRPLDKPAVAVEVGAANGLTVYASWNGATEVAGWEVLAGPTPDRLQPVAAAPRAGFETAIVAPLAGRYVAVRATDRAGAVLGVSEVVAARG